MTVDDRRLTKKQRIAQKQGPTGMLKRSLSEFGFSQTDLTT